ncbi:lipopolysaccharide assembly protein LapB [Olsenella sp. HMSC062G07]|uniref:tetratricopeptide repeat protein n=1 Tax=Olsenella sp. HMSC062G07 TaxID=1739330 RepID=UPI0008A55E4D|nr:tetratricopeptide repeat protein [Olsenella sp. HMSC062G07]OFK23522.1 hypothetical protein HMPREF2826_04410 [Olsenella sp. HMSC062G07]
MAHHVTSPGTAQKARKGGGATGAGRRSSARVRLAGVDGGDKGHVVYKPSLTDRLGGKKRLRDIAIAAFAVIIGVSMMLPSLSLIFASPGPKTPASSSTPTSDSPDASGASSAPASMSDVDATYGATTDSLKSKLEAATSDSDKLACHLGLGDDYAAWAAAARGFAKDDAGKAHVADLYGQAIDHYRQYLSINDSNAVKVKVAQCQLGNNDVNAAVDLLEQVAKDAPDYAPAWVYLGVSYAASGDLTKATNSFKKAEETDPNDEYGAKTLAQKYEAYLASKSGPSDSAGSDDGAGGSPSSPAPGTTLLDKLNSSAGTAAQ